MTHPRIYLAIMAALLLMIAGCEQTSVSEQEQIAQRETVLAGTPSVTPTLTITQTSPPTVTPSPTVGPSPTPPPPTPTLPPTATPLPPTPTANPALQGFSYCTQQVGDAAGGRFSAQLTNVQTEGFPAFERATFTFTETVGSAPLNARADCLSERDFVTTTGDAAAPGPYVLQVQLPAWLHDDAFRASAITRTLDFTTTRVMRSIAFRYDQSADAGMTITVPISQPLRFKLSLTRNPTRLVVETARNQELVASSDVLDVQLGENKPAPKAPVFFLLNGDIWRSDKDGTTQLIKSPEEETALAVSPNGQQIAFCRAVPGADPGDALVSVPSGLFIMDAEGKNLKALASRDTGFTGFNCADPTFNPDGSMLAWSVGESVDETGVTPSLRGVWTVPAKGGQPQRVNGGSSEWSRFAPQWLDGGALVYSAQAPDGRNTLFLHKSDGSEQDIGANLVMGDRYVSLGQPLADRSGKFIAIEAQRARNPGSDLLLLDATGAEQEQSDNVQKALSNVYWTRPLAWQDDGSLLYLTSDCASTIVQNYSLHVLSGSGDDKVLASGSTLGALGSAVATGNSITYVLLQRPQLGERGPEGIDPRSPASLWLWDVGAGTRGKLYDADRAIVGLAR